MYNLHQRCRHVHQGRFSSSSTRSSRQRNGLLRRPVARAEHDVHAARRRHHQVSPALPPPWKPLNLIVATTMCYQPDSVPSRTSFGFSPLFLAWEGVKRCDTIDTTKTHQLPLQLYNFHTRPHRGSHAVCATHSPSLFSLGLRLGIHMWIYMNGIHVYNSYMYAYMILYHFRVAMHVLRTCTSATTDSTYYMPEIFCRAFYLSVRACIKFMH